MRIGNRINNAPNENRPVLDSESQIAVAALSGHVFPVWLGFNGGKGVATGLGVFFVLEPIAAVAGFAVWIGIYLTIKISSIGSLGGTAVCAITVFILHGCRSPMSWAGLIIAAAVAATALAGGPPAGTGGAEEIDRVVCLDAATGTEVWKHIRYRLAAAGKSR